MKAVIYARFSSEKQNEASIEGQLRECTEYANYNNIEVIGTYIDRAQSAKTDHRPEFQHMIKDSYKGLFDTVLVWKLDRFARNRYDSAHYKSILKKNGVRVVSAKEVISQGAEGILLESLLEGYAEYYSAELSEKVKRGMTENALKVKANGVRAPFGYYVDESDHYQIDEKLVPIVKEIYSSLYLGGTKVIEIARILNARGITQRGYKMNYNSVFRILTNRKYIGEYKFGEVFIPAAIPAIIDKDTFDEVQQRLAKNKKAPAMHRSEDDYLLTTKLFCGTCGALMTGEIGTSHTSRQYRYYKCVRSKKKLCEKKAVKKDWIEDLIIDSIRELLSDDEALEELAGIVYEFQTAENTAIDVVKNQYDEVSRKLRNLAEAIANGIYSSETKKLLDELEAQKSNLEMELYEVQIKNPVLSKEQIMYGFYNLKKLDLSTKEGRQRLIDTFVNSIYLYDDHFVITFNYKGRSKAVTFDQINSSSLTSKGSPE
jgi:resolvase domain protein